MNEIEIYIIYDHKGPYRFTDKEEASKFIKNYNR